MWPRLPHGTTTEKKFNIQFAFRNANIGKIPFKVISRSRHGSARPLVRLHRPLPYHTMLYRQTTSVYIALSVFTKKKSLLIFACASMRGAWCACACAVDGCQCCMVVWCYCAVRSHPCYDLASYCGGCAAAKCKPSFPFLGRIWLLNSMGEIVM